MSNTTLKETINNFVGNKEFYTRNEYKLCVIAILGYEPTDLEVDLIFNRNDLLHQTKIFAILKSKLSTFNNNNYTEWFHRVDRDCTLN